MERESDMSDYIEITGLKIFAYHGVLEEEKKNGQDFFVNARLFYDMHPAGTSDKLEQALNYADACAYMTAVFKEVRFDLIEAAAEHLCEALLLHYPALEKVALTLRKPHAPIGLPFGDVSVNMVRSWHTAYLAVGSNMGDSRAIIEEAVQTLQENPKIKMLKISELITTKPYGPVEQDDFLNGCMRIETLYDPEELLAFLHEVEAAAGRRREIHWGPRTLDLDIIFYDGLVYESEDLIIPHADMHNRIFVLEPLMQLCPGYRHPVLGQTVAQLYHQL